jgi:hypothetical protein
VSAAIGIDPGLSGGIAIIDGDTLLVYPMPRNGSEFAADGIAELLNHEPCVVWCEQAQHVRTPAGLSAKATSVLFQCEGIVRGVCAGRVLRLEIVPPRKWQKAMLGEAAGDTKARACALVARLWPGRKIAKKYADAVLIAEYGRRMALAAPQPEFTL